MKLNRRTARQLHVIALATMFASAPLLAQEAPTTQPTTQPATAPSTQPASGNGAGPHITTQPGGGLLLNFKDAGIDSVLDELSAAAGFIVVKEVKPAGRVTLVSKQSVSKEDAVALLNTVLRNAGYAAIQQGRILKIVNKDAAKRLNIPVRSGSDPLKIEPTDELITQVIPLRYADAVQLKTDLTPMVNAEADFTANASSNALVITDTSANIRRIVEIVNALDTHMADASDVKVFQLQYAAASTAAKLVNDVFGTNAQTGQGGFPGGGNFPGGGGNFPGGGGNFGGGGGGGGAAQRFQNFIRGVAGAGAGGQQRTQQRVVASSDDRTNTVVVTGPSDTLKVVERVIKEIDANPAADEQVFVFRLKNADSLNVESVANMLFNGTSTGTNRSQPTLSSARTTPTNNSGSNRGTSGRTIGSGSTIGGGGNSGFGNNNRLTQPTNNTQNRGNVNVSQNAQNLASSLNGQATIIADPDTNSILVRTAPKNYERVKQILEELDRPVAQVLIKVLIAEVTHNNASDLGVEFSVLNIRANGLGSQVGTNFGLAPRTQGAVAQILESDFTATIRALETTGKLDVLSRPYILASDNQLASITVGQEIPFITDSRITDNGQTINTVEYGDIGILLDVIPHINPDGFVTLDVAPEISTLTDQTVPISNTVSSPVIAKRSAQSRVAVRTGQTVVIGGLMEDRKTESIDKVPLLGDIPWLGALFQHRTSSKTKTELLIFLTPHVAARPDVLPGMTQQERDALKLMPNAVQPGTFEDHMDGLKRGEAPAEENRVQPAPGPTSLPSR